MAAVVEVIGLLERTPLTKEALEVIFLILFKLALMLYHWSFINDLCIW